MHRVRVRRESDQIFVDTISDSSNCRPWLTKDQIAQDRRFENMFTASVEDREGIAAFVRGWARSCDGGCIKEYNVWSRCLDIYRRFQRRLSKVDVSVPEPRGSDFSWHFAPDVSGDPYSIDIRKGDLIPFDLAVRLVEIGRQLHVSRPGHSEYMRIGFMLGSELNLFAKRKSRRGYLAGDASSYVPLVALEGLSTASFFGDFIPQVDPAYPDKYFLRDKDGGLVFGEAAKHSAFGKTPSYFDKANGEKMLDRMRYHYPDSAWEIVRST